MKLRYAITATNDVDGIFLYVAQRVGVAAELAIRGIEDAVRGLLQYPMRGRIGRVEGTRELVVSRSPYIVAYTTKGATIEILAVLDGRRCLPEAF